MAVDKALNRAPKGLSGRKKSDDIEIVVEIEPDEDSNVVEFGPVGREKGAGDFNANLAEILNDGQLSKLAGELIQDFEDDIASRSDWMRTYVDGLELLGTKIEDRTEPWPGACGVYHPLMSEALVKFQAETMMETFPAAGPVRTKIIGEETPEKKEAADRVMADMNYQLTDRMIEYRPEHERMLWGLGLAGNAFKKIYFDPNFNRQVSMYVPAEDLVVPYGASNLETASRITHVMRKTENEVKKLQASGFYRDIELEEPTNALDDIEKKIAEKMGFKATTDDRYKLLEMHVDLVLEEEDEKNEIALPYVVTIEKSSQTVLAIRRNWREEDKFKLKRNHFVHYPYIPGFGFYAFGLIHLIGAFAKSSTSIIRQLVDAGTLSNLPGGFKTKGLRVKGDDTPIAPAEWRDVDVASGTMRDNIMPLPYKEPSQVLYTLLGTIVEEGRRFASASDLKVSDMSAQSPVGTTLAILERTLKVMSAIQSRIHYAMKQEFRLLRDIIRDYTDDKYAYTPETGTPRLKKKDYDQCDVIPVSDPNSATMAQKVVQYQAVMQMAEQNPDIYDLPYLHRQMLEALGIKNANKLVPIEEDNDDPVDPVTENMNILNGKGVKSFITQDHQAHIIVHMNAMQDPLVQEIVGQNPNAQKIQAAMQAHIQEHLAFEYRKRIEDAAGVAYPGPDQEMKEDTEIEISRLAAAASQKVLQQSQAEAAQKQAQQAAQDPVLQLQQQELAIKAKDAATKEMKVKVDAAAKNDELDIEKEKIAAQERIAGLNAGVKIATAKTQQESKDQIEGLKIGVQVARESEQANINKEQANQTQTKDAQDKLHEMMKTGIEQDHEITKTSMEQQHEVEQAAAQQAHEAELADKQAQASSGSEEE